MPIFFFFFLMDGGGLQAGLLRKRDFFLHSFPTAIKLEDGGGGGGQNLDGTVIKRNCFCGFPQKKYINVQALLVLNPDPFTYTF